MNYTDLNTLAANVATFTKTDAKRIAKEVSNGLVNDPQTITSIGPDGPVFGYRTSIKINQVYKLTVTEFFGQYTVELTNNWN